MLLPLSRQPDCQMIPVGCKKVHIFEDKQHPETVQEKKDQTYSLTFSAFAFCITGQSIVQHQ